MDPCMCDEDARTSSDTEAFMSTNTTPGGAFNTHKIQRAPVILPTSCCNYAFAAAKGPPEAQAHVTNAACSG